MDWTGGVRKRFASGKNNATLQKQKAHFAKRRAALQMTPKSQSPFRPDFWRPAPIASRTTSTHGRHRIPHEENKPIGTVLERERSKPSRGTRGRNQQVKRESDVPIRNDDRHNSVIYVSSRPTSSRSESIASQSVQEYNRQSCGGSTTKANAMTAEERLLMANRRRLLGQSDWLGLSTLRPLQMNFQASEDRERIGKRRKVAKSTSYRAKPARKRLLTPLFEHHPSREDYTMSGALPPEDIQIKVGTDAFASQTQPSRRSHTTGKTSMRPPSTEFGPLSEESMLLNAEDVPFNALDLPERLYSAGHANLDSNVSLATFTGSQANPREQGRGANPELQMSDSASHHYGQTFFQPGEPREIPPWNERQFAKHDLHSDPRDRSNLDLHYIDQELVVPTPLANPAHMSTALHEVHDRTQNSRSMVEAADEDEWRQIWNIPEDVSSHNSGKAVKSSSMHITTSESSARPAFQGVIGTNPPSHAPALARADTGTPTPTGDPMIPDETLQHSLGPTMAVQSPSTSLELITKLANQPAMVSKREQEEIDDNALWRQFIVGSQHSSDKEDGESTKKITDDRGDEDYVLNAITSSNFEVSGLGTSNESTVGDTLLVTRSTSSTMSRTPERRKKELSSDEQHKMTIRNTSLSAQTDANKDDVEGEQSTSGQTNVLLQTSNEELYTTSILNPRRFKRPQKHTGLPARNPSRFISTRRRKTGAPRQDRSVYDLLESGE